MYLEAGATVYASTKPEDYRAYGPQLVTARKAEGLGRPNFSIVSLPEIGLFVLHAACWR